MGEPAVGPRTAFRNGIVDWRGRSAFVRLLDAAEVRRDAAQSARAGGGWKLFGWA